MCFVPSFDIKLRFVGVLGLCLPKNSGAVISSCNVFVHVCLSLRILRGESGAVISSCNVFVHVCLSLRILCGGVYLQAFKRIQS